MKLNKIVLNGLKKVDENSMIFFLITMPLYQIIFLKDCKKFFYFMKFLSFSMTLHHLQNYLIRRAIEKLICAMNYGWHDTL